MSENEKLVQWSELKRSKRGISAIFVHNGDPQGMLLLSIKTNCDMHPLASNVQFFQ